MGGVVSSPIAKSTPFDNATNGFTAQDVQEAIEEVSLPYTTLQHTKITSDINMLYDGLIDQFGNGLKMETR